jgi:hypothetical protein
MAIKGVTAQETLSRGRIRRLMGDYHEGMRMLASNLSRKEPVAQVYCNGKSTWEFAFIVLPLPLSFSPTVSRAWDFFSEGGTDS